MLACLLGQVLEAEDFLTLERRADDSDGAVLLVVVDPLINYSIPDTGRTRDIQVALVVFGGSHVTNDGHSPTRAATTRRVAARVRSAQ